ncbi:MAG: hypothetical protein IQL11_06360 [Bacteroidales bacterium]|nr:hypothetical protein [Bacteroidales bacterium]
MTKLKFLINFSAGVFILLFLLFCASCERNDYELLDPESAGVWTHFDTNDGLPGNTVTDIGRDSKDNLWIAFAGQGIARYNYDTWTSYRTTNSLLLSNIVSCIAENKDGSIIIGTALGLSVLSETNTWDSYLDPLIITSVKVASNGNIWIGTADQGFFVNRGSGYEKVYNDLYKTVNVIEEDASGNVWLGTNNGLIKWDGKSYSYLGMLNGLPNNRVSSLLRDRQNRLWIGTRGGKTVSWIDNRGIHQLQLFNNKDTCLVNDIFQDRSGSIWFATSSDGLVKYDGIIPLTIKAATGKLPENTILSIGEDKYGNLWFGLATKGVVRYTLPIE